MQAAAACMLVSVAAAQTDFCQWSNFRLPAITVPSAYDLDLTVDLSDVSVKGAVKITAEQTVASKCIVMHAEESMDTMDIMAMASDGMQYTGAIS